MAGVGVNPVGFMLNQGGRIPALCEALITAKQGIADGGYVEEAYEYRVTERTVAAAIQRI